MARLTVLLCAASLVACDSGSSPRLPRPTSVSQPAPNPSPPAPPPPTPVPATPITLGQQVRSRFVGTNLAFELTAPSTGTLVARLTWDVWSHGSLLVLTLETTEVKPADPEYSPLVGRISVAAGQTYRLMISGGGTDWFYDEAFVLTTAIE